MIHDLLHHRLQRLVQRNLFIASLRPDSASKAPKTRGHRPSQAFEDLRKVPVIGDSWTVPEDLTGFSDHYMARPQVWCLGWIHMKV